MSEFDKYLLDLQAVLDGLRKEKSLLVDNPTKARALAVAITELEKMIAYYEKYVVN